MGNTPLRGLPVQWRPGVINTFCQRQVTWLRVEGMNSGWPQEQRRRFQLGTRLYPPGLLPIFALTSFQFSIQLVEIVGNSEIQRRILTQRQYAYIKEQEKCTGYRREIQTRLTTHKVWARMEVR